MNKVILNNNDYSFNASTGVITIYNYTEYLTKEYLLLITNVSSNTIIYNFGCEGLGGDIVGNTIELDIDTTTMSDADNLQIILFIPQSEGETVIANLLELIRRQTSANQNILEELQIQTKYLKKIYNPE